MDRGASLDISLDILSLFTRWRAFENKYKGCDAEAQGRRGLLAREDVQDRAVMAMTYIYMDYSSPLERSTEGYQGRYCWVGRNGVTRDLGQGSRKCSYDGGTPWRPKIKAVGAHTFSIMSVYSEHIVFPIIAHIHIQFIQRRCFRP